MAGSEQDLYEEEEQEQELICLHNPKRMTSLLWSDKFVADVRRPDKQSNCLARARYWPAADAADMPLLGRTGWQGRAPTARLGRPLPAAHAASSSSSSWWALLASNTAGRQVGISEELPVAKLTPAMDAVKWAHSKDNGLRPAFPFW
eukprot:jgi/Mesen1/3234/ME000187S02406